MVRRMWVLALIGIGSNRIAAGDHEIGFVETFSLATDRGKTLAQLVPGSPDYYFFHCLHAQNTGDDATFERFHRAWGERGGWNDPRFTSLRARQPLVAYARDPRRALDAIRNHLSLRFDHRREDARADADLPSALRPGALDVEGRVRSLLARQISPSSEFTPDGLSLLIGRELEPGMLRQVLRMLDRADVPGLSEKVVTDLRYRGSGGFGSLPIHARMTLEQLEECGRMQPMLYREDRFVRALASRMRPAGHTDVDGDAAARQAWLERLTGFVLGLDPVHDSLRAHVLYHRLRDDRVRGTLSRELFLDYLRIPRPVAYLSRAARGRPGAGQAIVDMGARFDSETGLPPVQTDEELVRDYLERFLLDSPGLEPFDQWVDRDYLRKLQAEARILAGDPETERYAAILSPGEYQQLKDRVDLDLLPGNPTRLGPDDPVTLTLRVKNVAHLIVKAFTIQALNLYRETGEEIDLAIDLDGLVAAQEQRFTYDTLPLESVTREFRFPWMQGRGIWVVEFVGNGRSSRALVRKGRLHLIEEGSTAGQAFRVLDESGTLRPEATLWTGGREYRPDDSGRVLLPFSEQPGPANVVVSLDGFASLARIRTRPEQYAFRAGFHVERESLLDGARARLIIRPALSLAGRPVSVGLLEDVKLVIEATDLDGVTARDEIAGFELHDDAESVREFQVPPRLMGLRCTLTAKVERLGLGGQQELADSWAVEVNANQRTDAIPAWYLDRSADRYRLLCRGRNGEAIAGQAVTVELKHRFFVTPFREVLRSDDSGRVDLGELPGVDALTLAGFSSSGLTRRWTLAPPAILHPPVLHVAEGESISLPFDSPGVASMLPEVSLFGLAGDVVVSDHGRAVKGEPGRIEITGLAAGTYELHLRPTGTRIVLEVVPGPRRARYLVAPREALETGGARFLAVTGLARQGEELVVSLADAGPDTRVHVFASWTVPPFRAFENLVGPVAPGLARFPRDQAESLFASGRSIGDEYRYVLERRYAPRYPGIMLERPGLVLNPWARRDASSERQEALGGEDWNSRQSALRAPPASPRSSPPPQVGQRDPWTLDFLGRPARVLANLRPEGGTLRIPTRDLPPHVRILVTDGRSRIERTVAPAGAELELRDRRLAESLDPARSFASARRTTGLARGQVLTVQDRGRIKTYGTLRQVFDLLATLCHDPALPAFRFVADWGRLSREEKQQKYSESVSHELNFFLAHKDPGFFAEVVKPYIAHKREKTFLDRWLLDEDLTGDLDPWPYGRLNVVERILLARRTGREEAIRRQLADAAVVAPPDPAIWARLFETALHAGSLGAGRGMRAARNGPGAALLDMDMDAGLPIANGEFDRLEDSRADDSSLVNLTKSYVDKLARMTPSERMKLKTSISKFGARAESPAPAAAVSADLADGAAGMGPADDLELRGSVRQLYRKVDRTKELVETHYYRRPIEEQGSDLIRSNPFWIDFAGHRSGQPFLSGRFPHAAGNLPEVMFVLSVLDLPFEAEEPQTRVGDARVELTATSPLVAFHEAIEPAPGLEDKARILVSQDLYPAGARHRVVDGLQVDNFVTDEFLVGRAYGCDVVLTNTGSTPMDLDVLLQIPRGSLPLGGVKATRSLPVSLSPYQTRRLSYAFYFPRTGSYPHHPVEAAHRGRVVARAEPFNFQVVAELTRVDTTSWDHVSQNGSMQEVLEFLRERNLTGADLGRIAFRMKNQNNFLQVIEVLRQRQVFDPVIWSYGLFHGATEVIREYLETTPLAGQVGAWIDSPLLTVDPVERGIYEHYDYAPLVHARAHPLGATRRILNEQLREHYLRLLDILAHKPALDSSDWLALAYYLLLQDRFEEGLAAFDRVDPRSIVERLPFDSMHAWISFLREDFETARKIAASYVDHPVPRWRDRFRAILSQLDDASPATIDADTPREKRHDQLAATEPALDLAIEGKVLRISHRNVGDLTIHYYPMDVELLFSRNPFVQQQTSRFSWVEPTRSELLTPTSGEPATKHLIPEDLHNRNMMVEVASAGLRSSRPYFASSLTVQVIESYGQLQVSHLARLEPRPRIYVKVYARMDDGTVRFYKDGYVDHRLRFDYATLSTDELDHVERFALLVLSDELGAVVKETDPPAR